MTVTSRRRKAPPSGNWNWQHNEAVSVFQRIIGPYAMALYSTLVQQSKNGLVLYSLRRLRPTTGQSPSCIDHGMKVMEHVGMLRTRNLGGNRGSECELLDLREVFQGWGDSNQCNREIARLQAEVKMLRTSMAGKKPAARGFSMTTVERDASALSGGHQRGAGETRAGLHQIQQDAILQDSHPTSPAQLPNCGKPKGLPNESSDVTEQARKLFTGVMDVMRAHLFETNRPPHLANGAEEWDKYGFGRLAVVRATMRGRCCELVLSARAPEVTREGLEKYARRWRFALKLWFNRYEIQVVFERSGQAE